MIIGKRQIILAALVLGLGIAVYLNWQYSSLEAEMLATPALHAGEGERATFGEAQFVTSPGVLDGTSASVPVSEPEGGEVFFVEAQISRQRARDEAVETLAFMLADANLSNDQQAALILRASDLARSIEVESKVENLIRARGFGDVMVYYDTQRADIMIRTSGLVSQEVMVIKNIVLNETSIAAENISIIEIN